MIRYALLYTLFITQTVTLLAGSFRHLNIKDGLSSRQVFQINQDREGFIWAFTPTGVDRYDGNEIRHYKLDATLEARDHILSATVMTVDLEGNIWVMLKNGKIYTYNRLTDSFNLWTNLAEILPAPVIVNDIFFADPNRIFFCLSTGIYYMDVPTRKLTNAGLGGEYVNRLIRGEGNTFYAGTNTHVYALELINNELLNRRQITMPVETRIESLFNMGSVLYAGSFSDGLFVCDLNNDITVHPEFIPNVPIRAIVPTPSQTILIATDGAGLYEIDCKTNRLKNRYVTNEDDEMSLSGNTVADVMVDSKSHIWVATYTNGISYLNPDSHLIQWIKHEKNNPGSLLSNHVNVIFEDSQGDRWYGTNNGVSLHRRNTNTWTHFLNDESKDSAFSPVVLALCEDTKGDIWVGGYGIGVYLINKSTGRVRKVDNRNHTIAKGVPTDYIYAIYSEGDYVWLGGIEGEFTRYNTSTGEYVYYPIDCIGDIRPGTDNSLLIAGCDGLARFDKTTGETVWYRTFAGKTITYPIRCLLQSRLSGEIWLATDGEGLIRFDPKTEKAEIYTTGAGLASNAINSLTEDRDGRIWFTTEKELYCFDVQNDKLISMNESMDINWGFYNPNAARLLGNGMLAFGTAEGALVFEPALDVDEKETVKLLLTDFKLLYKSVKAGAEGSLLKQAIDKTGKVALEYAQNSLSISFSSLNFNHPYKIRYEYMLENFNEEWQVSDRIRNVDYMNLSPGQYTFRVKAINKYTSEILDERELRISIREPFWASWDAILLYFLIAAILIFLFFQFIRQKITEYNANEKIRAFINIAHDIRTPITLIKAPLTELQSNKELPEESRKSLSVATKNAEKLFSMVTQLLDLQKTELHPGKLNISEHDLYEYMEEKVSDFRMAARQKGLELFLDIQPGFPRVCFDKDKMNNIFDNLLSNALKYTVEGSVRITVSYTRKKWSVQVIDTGIGIPEKEQKNLFHQFYRAGNAVDTGETGSGIGLMLARRVIRLHHGKITFKSIENQGTTFTVVFPQIIKTHHAVSRQIPDEIKTAAAPVTSPQNDKVGTAKGKNVLLLAEDNDDMREYLTDSLSADYEVISVTDGGKALQTAKEINPDIIISDVIMPVLQGDELCRMLKSSVETSHIPIILLTALNERENIIQGLEAGANDYIIKPFDFSVLKVRLRNILQSRQHLRETVLAAETNLNEIDYTSQLDKKFLDQAMEIIQNEMSNTEFSINDFCRMLGMSRTSVYNKIKTLTDQSPNDFIRIIRLNHARELLLSRKYTIGEVSYMVGFSDPKYFSTCFKKQFGLSPSKV